MSRTCFRLMKRCGLYGVALALVGIAAPAMGQDTPMTTVGQADTIMPLRCDALTAAPASVSISSSGGPGAVNLRWPDGNAWIAQLTVRRAAVGAHGELRFTMQAPAGTPYAFVELTATDAQGQPVTTFDDDLRLVLRPHDRNCSAPSAGPGPVAVYLYNIGDETPADAMAFAQGGLGKGGELRYEGSAGEPRATSVIRDFSGFILAQGRR